jgi:hypothetical protein
MPNSIEPNCLFLIVFLALIMLIIYFNNQDNDRYNDNRENFYVLPYAENKKTEDYYPKDSMLLFAKNKCAKSCCKNMWPLPFEVDDAELCDKNGKRKYVPLNYSCQGENGAGCVCVTERESRILDSRAHNKYITRRFTKHNTLHNDFDLPFNDDEQEQEQEQEQDQDKDQEPYQNLDPEHDKNDDGVRDSYERNGVSGYDETEQCASNII